MATMPKAGPEALGRFASVAPGGPEGEERKMFGMPCTSVHGNMFMGLFGDEFMLRLGPDDHAEALRAGAAPSAAMGRTMREYVSLSEAMAGDREQLGGWVARAHRSAAALPMKEPKPRGPRKAAAPKAPMTRRVHPPLP